MSATARAANRSTQQKQQNIKLSTSTTASNSGPSRELCTSCQSRIKDILQLNGTNEKDNSSAGDSQKEFRVWQTSMPDYAVNLVRKKLESYYSDKTESSIKQCQGGLGEIGKNLTKFLDDHFGGAWNVIIGQEFAASVIYGANSFLHCGIGGDNYLLFCWHSVSLLGDAMDSRLY